MSGEVGDCGVGVGVGGMSVALFCCRVYMGIKPNGAGPDGGGC